MNEIDEIIYDIENAKTPKTLKYLAKRARKLKKLPNITKNKISIIISKINTKLKHFV